MRYRQTEKIKLGRFPYISQNLVNSWPQTAGVKVAIRLQQCPRCYYIYISHGITQQAARE